MRLIDADLVHEHVKPYERSDEQWSVTGGTAIRLIHNTIDNAPIIMQPEVEEKFWKDWATEADRILAENHFPVKVVKFLLAPDSEATTRYGACKEILKVIGDYDDNICYGYAGRSDCAMFRDFKAILQDCVDNKCDMVWM